MSITSFERPELVFVAPRFECYILYYYSLLEGIKEIVIILKHCYVIDLHSKN